LLPALAACTLDAAVIRGVVVEDQSGRPLARSLVVLQPVAGSQASPTSARTNSYGSFEFNGLPGGAYMISASRRGFAPVSYGQKRWKGSGLPVFVEEAGATVLNVRLQRFGSVTGAILDENDVGLPEHDVVVYRNTRPPEIAGRARTDDRGIYRIWGLEPGTYLVRTLARQFEETGYLPTWSKETSRIDEARQVDVKLDQEIAFSDVRPFRGQLFTVAGRAQTIQPTPVTLTLISDAGSDTTVSDSNGIFKFNPVAPGPYELTATASDRRTGGPVAAYMPIHVDRDRTDYRVTLASLPELRVSVEDTRGKPVDLATITIMARRKDLSGNGKAETLRMPQGRVLLLPGRWDLSLAAAANSYVAGFTASGAEVNPGARADGWNEVLLLGSNPIPAKFALSFSPGAIHGTVFTAAHDPVPGAPVFLEAYDPAQRRRLTELHITRTDTRGQYQFYGLAPGAYRILASFEFQSPDPVEFESAAPKSVLIEESHDPTQELSLYVIR
jgi:hypothetical protein